MDIIIENAEQELFEDLSAASGFMPELRCIHFKQAGVSSGGGVQAATSPFVSELANYLAKIDARIFVCHDGDVFVIAPGLRQHDLSGFLHHLEAKLGPASFMGLAYLFHVGVDWPKLRGLCERKFQSLKRAGAGEERYQFA
jgi:hypothetical protein